MATQWGPAGPKAVYYFCNWAIYARGYPPKKIPLEHVDEITYAFFDLKPNASGLYVPTLTDAWADTDKRFGADEGVDGADLPGLPFYGNFNQLKKLKAQKPSFCVGMSVGGWTMSAHFSDAVATPQAREGFAEGVLDILRKYQQVFSVIDFDWEYISPPGKNYGNGGNVSRPDDGANFVTFLDVMRRRLNETGCAAIKLTAAVTGVPSKMDGLPVEAMNRYLDEFRVMTYDYASSAWGQCPAGHHSNLYPTPYSPLSASESINAYLRRGVPARKLYLGVVFYSRGFANTNGLGHPSSGVVKNKTVEDGNSDYKDLPVPGATEYWDPQARATYCYDPRTRDLNSYDSVDSVREKCAYVREKGLGGIIVWEMSGDVRDVNHPRSLIRALKEGLAGAPALPYAPSQPQYHPPPPQQAQPQYYAPSQPQPQPQYYPPPPPQAQPGAPSVYYPPPPPPQAQQGSQNFLANFAQKIFR